MGIAVGGLFIGSAYFLSTAMWIEPILGIAVGVGIAVGGFFLGFGIFITGIISTAATCA